MSFGRSWGRRALAWLLAVVAVTSAWDVARAQSSRDLEGAQEAIVAWDMPRAERHMKRLVAEAPDNAEVLLLSGHLHLMQGRYEKATAVLQKAVAANAGGRLAKLAAHYLTLAQQTHLETKDYEEHRTKAGHFVIRYQAGPDAVLVPYAEEMLETAWSELTALFQHEPATPIRVDIYPAVEVLGSVSSLTVEEIKTSGTIALCKYNRLMITSPRDLVYGYTWLDTLAHEFIHLLITQKSRNTVPIWLHEGLAKYYEQLWRGRRKPKLERPSEDLLARALADDKLISFEAMSPSMAKLPSQEATATAFAEVFTVIEFLVDRAGISVAARLPELMRQGKSDRDAVAELARLSWSRFEPAWKSYLKGRGLRTLKAKTPQPLLFKGDHTEAAELKALEEEKSRKYTWLGDQLRLRERWKAAAREYRKAAKASKDHSPIIQSKLGYALIQLGDLDAAITELSRPLDHFSSYVLLHLYKGEAHLKRGDLEAARRHLEEAVAINPFDRDVHGHLATVYAKLDLPELAARERKLHRIIRSSGP